MILVVDEHFLLKLSLPARQRRLLAADEFRAFFFGMSYQTLHGVLSFGNYCEWLKRLHPGDSCTVNRHCTASTTELRPRRDSAAHKADHHLSCA